MADEAAQQPDYTDIAQNAYDASLDRTLGPREPNATAVNLSDYAAKALADNPNEAVTTVDDSNIEHYKMLKDVNWNKEKVYGINATPDFTKYSDLASGLQTFGRGAANSLTFGLYAAATDRFRSPEEREAIAKQARFHPVASFAGEVVPYLIPGEGLLKAATVAPRIGEIMAEGLFKAESSSMAKMVTQSAIDGTSAAMTAATNEASLDDFSRESVNSILVNGAIGAVTGGALGVALHAINPLTSAAKRVIGMNDGKVTADLNSIQPDEKIMSTLNTGDQRAANINLTSELFNEKNMIDQLPPEQKTLEQTQRSAFIGDFLNGIAKDDDLANRVYETSEENLATHLDVAQKHRDAQNEFGYLNPKLGIAQASHENLNSVMDDVYQLNGASIGIEKEFNEATLDAAEDFERSDALNSKIIQNDGSLYKTTLQDLKNTNSRVAQKAKIIQETGLDPNSEIGKLTIEARLKGYFNGLNKEAVESMAGAIASATKGLPLAGGLPLTSEIYKFLDTAVEGLDKVWYKIKPTLSREQLGPMSEIYSRVKTPLYQALTNQADFGVAATQRAVTKEARRNLIAADEQLKKFFGVPLKKNQIGIPKKSFDKIRQIGSGKGNMHYADAKDQIDAYLQTVQENMPKLGFTPEMNSELNAFGAKVAGAQMRSNQLMDYMMAVNDTRVSQFWKKAEKGTIGEPEGSHGGMGKVMRVIHMAKDLAVGGLGFAQIQATRLAMDVGFDILGKMKNPKNYKEFFENKVRAMNKIQDMKKAQESKIGNMASQLVTGSIGVGKNLVKAHPYVTAMMTTDGQGHIDAKFNQIIKKLVEIKDNPNIMTNIQMQNEPLKYLHHQMDQETNQKVLGTIVTLMNGVPNGEPELEGGNGPTMMQKAEFCDRYTALADPEAFMELVRDGTCTSEQKTIFKNAWPATWNFTVNSVIENLVKSRNEIPLDKRLELFATFGIPSVKLTQPLMNSQDMGDGGDTLAPTSTPTSPSPGGKQPRTNASGVRVTGMKNWNAQKEYGTVSQNSHQI